MDAVSTAADAPLTVDDFTVQWCEPDRELHAPLRDAASIPFEQTVMVRKPVSYKGQRHFPGWYYAAKTGSHVSYESWLERDHAIALDHDPQVVCFAAQPFWLAWPDRQAGRHRSHAPDFFARLTGGQGLVIDCRPADRIDERAASSFAAMRTACELAGWGYRVVGARDPVAVVNLRWLSGYRHPRYGVSEELKTRVVAAFDLPAPLVTTAGSVGDPIVVLPVVFHLLWHGVLAADLSLPLRDHTVVSGRWRSS